MLPDASGTLVKFLVVSVVQLAEDMSQYGPHWFGNGQRAFAWI